MDKISKAIFSSLIYSQIFSSPLDKNELFAKLHTPKLITFSEFDQKLTQLCQQNQITQKNNYYTLPSSTHLIRIKKNNLKFSKAKLEIIRQNILPVITTPGVKAIFLTGSLSCLNSSQDDDIDLLVITSKNSLWLTRFFLLLKTKKIRRKPNVLNFKNKFCFNLFLEEDILCFPKHNLFVANEIIQSFPLYDPNNLYPEFLIHNTWLKKYLSNSMVKENEIIINYFHRYHHPLHLLNKYIFQKYKQINSKHDHFIFFFNLLNYLFYILQYLYMKGKITHETISLKSAFFHPSQIDQKVIHQYSAGKTIQNLLK